MTDLQLLAERAAVRRGDPIPGLRLDVEREGKRLTHHRLSYRRRYGATQTIFFPDVSHYDADRGVVLQPGTVVVIAKSTHGTRFVDRAYGTFKAQAVGVGCYFTAYHWLNHGSGAAQARYNWDSIGWTPVMVDAEDTAANTGYNGPLTVADIVDFVTELRRLGGVCQLVYLPHWYWQTNMGSPDLAPLGRLGVGLVSSNYTTYSDTGPGWVGYGGLPIAQWQYSDNLPYGVSFTDFNGYKGPLDQYRTMVTGGVRQMEQDDLVKAWNGQSRPVAIGWILGDQANMRDWWHTKPGTATILPPPDGSRADLLVKAAQAVLAGPALTFTDAQVAALTPMLTAAVTAAHDALTLDADGPVIKAALDQALTGVTLHVDVP